MPATPTFGTIVNQMQTFMNNNGYNIDYKSSWLTPWDDITQQEYSGYYWDHNSNYLYLTNDHLMFSSAYSDAQIIRKEVNRIKAKLEQYIAGSDVSRIITHNNWGEYGHEHHKAVNKAVRELAVKYRKDVWMLGCDNGNFVDVPIPAGITYTLGSFNTPDLYTGIRTIYKNNWCWTWSENIPSGDHKFIKIVEAGVDKSNILTGESITVSGQTQSEPGAYIFDGVDDYMTLEGNKSPSFTLAMSVKPDQIKAMDIAKMTEYPLSATFDRNFYLNSDGRVNALINDGSSKIVTSTTALTAGQWTHILMTGNGSSLNIYINGVLENTITAGTANTGYSTPELVLGQTGSTTSFFSGQISDVRLFDRVLTDDEIAALSGMISTITHNITASAGTGGSINPSGTLTLSEGTDKVFSITADLGFKISDVKVNSISVGAVSSYTFNNIVNDNTIVATFSSTPTYSVTASSGTGGSVSPAGKITLNRGSNQIYNITASIGYRIADVKVDNISVGVVSSYTFNNIVSNHTISAIFVPITYSITGSAGTNGTVSPGGIVTVNYGDSRTYTITASTGYKVSDVRVDNISIGAVSEYTFNNITANHTISATFIINTFTITASSGTGGLITPSGTATLNYGSGKSYTITPDTGYNITDVLVDNISMGAVTSFTFSNITSDHTISATFALITYTITGSNTTGGSLTPSGIMTVNFGSSQTYSITANYGYEISEVRIDNVTMGPVSSFTFRNINSNHTISVAFTLIRYAISGSSGPGGSVTPSGAITVTHGSNQTCTISPDTGFEISDVTVDGTSIGSVPEYTFTEITGNHTISASFSLLKYAISPSAGIGGSISPQNEIIAEYGTSSSFTITPDEGYNISDVTVDNVSVGAADNYTFTGITENHSISVSFVLKTYSITSSHGVNGSISPAGDTTVDHGTSAVYTITPDDGYKISDVMVDNASVGAVSGYTFENVVTDHTISVTFAYINKYTITANSSSGGSINPKGIIIIPEESSQTYLISADKGYRIDKVLIDNFDQGILSEYTFNSIYSDHSISVEFTSETEVSVYPSPFKDEFKVKIETPLDGKFDIYVFDISSRLIYKQSGVDGNVETEINLRSSPKGVYLVRLFYGNSVVKTTKVVKY